MTPLVTEKRSTATRRFTALSPVRIVNGERIVRIRRVKVMDTSVGRWIGAVLTNPFSRAYIDGQKFMDERAARRYAEERGWRVLS